MNKDTNSGTVIVRYSLNTPTSTNPFPGNRATMFHIQHPTKSPIMPKPRKRSLTARSKNYITTPGTPPSSLSLALPMETSPFVHGLQSCAEKFHLAINVGIHVPNGDGKKVLNRSIWIDENGEIIARYDKLHLFDYAAAGLRESDSVEAGKSIVRPVETVVGRVGLLICFDLRFPEPSLALRHLSTEILTYPSAFTVPTGKLHWETLLRARAIETQSYVIAAAQVGAHNEKRTSYGHSMVIDPQGRVVLDMGEEGQDGGKLGMVSIDLESVRETRERMPLLRRT
ncbi:Carbon-nitrogen hydrolase [Ciborinia camelliae]|nr:Carbon-nitrogen hydrolase [Ciborinia camelliae]